MNRASRIQILRNVVVPASVVTDPAAFGGKVVGDGLQGDLILVDGRATNLQTSRDLVPAKAIVLPRLVEPHCHSDKCQAAARLDATVTSLQDAITLQAQDKRNWTESDLQFRVGRGLSELDCAGELMRWMPPP